MALIVPEKVIKTHIGRAKASLNKHQVVKCIAEIIPAIKIHIFAQKKIMGSSKLEIEYALDELVGALNSFPEMQRYLNAPLSYKKGRERKTYFILTKVLKRITEDMNKAESGEGDDEAEAKRRREAMLAKMEEFLRNRDMIRAGAMLKKLMQESDNDPTVIMDAAEKYYAAGEYRQVAEYAMQAIKKDPKTMRAYKLAVNAFRNLEEYGKALNVFKQAIRVFGHHPNIYINLARIYAEWGKPDKAAECAKMVLKLDPENAEAKEFLAKKAGNGNEA